MANTNALYNAAYSGTLSGLSSRWLTSAAEGGYANAIICASAFAEAVDGELGVLSGVSQAASDLLQQICSSFWEGRIPIKTDGADYAADVIPLCALYTAAAAGLLPSGTEQPLTNTFFLDSGTTNEIQNGQIGTPFLTIADGLVAAAELELSSVTFILTEGLYDDLVLDDTSPQVSLVAWSNAIVSNITLTDGAVIYLEKITCTNLTVTDSIANVVNCLIANEANFEDSEDSYIDLLTLGRSRVVGGNTFGPCREADAPSLRWPVTIPALTAPETTDVIIPFTGALPGDTFTATGIDDTNGWPAEAKLSLPRCENNNQVIVTIMAIDGNVAASECAIRVTQFCTAGTN